MTDSKTPTKLRTPFPTLCGACGCKVPEGTPVVYVAGVGTVCGPCAPR